MSTSKTMMKSKYDMLYQKGIKNNFCGYPTFAILTSKIARND